MIEISGGVATIWMDQKNEKINKVSADLVACFEAALEPLTNNNDVKAIVMMSKKKDFIAGADIEMFQKVQTFSNVFKRFQTFKITIERQHGRPTVC